jgi:hypothetical protein
MKILGRHISKWWLLVIPPVLVLGCPLLLMIVFMGNGLAGAILGRQRSGIGRFITRREKIWLEFTSSLGVGLTIKSPCQPQLSH